MIELNSTLSALFGGALIGIAVTLMLLFNGRVTGISGIIASSLTKPSKDGAWRLMFLAGMILGGALMYNFQPDYFVNLSGRNITLIGIAGLLV
ncbi:MAG: YeeE/YedE family protein, partial [Bdellovibrionota bacterium]